MSFPQLCRVIVNSAKLIAEKIDRNGFEAGYDWCTSCLRDVGFVKLANEVHLAKASKFLSSKEFDAAIGVFKVGFVWSVLTGMGQGEQTAPAFYLTSGMEQSMGASSLKPRL